MSTLTAADRAQETANNIGASAAIVLRGAAAPGLRTFAAAGLDGEIVPYAIEHETSGQWEIGSGEYVQSTHTLNRTTVYQNSSGNTSLIDFANGVVDVWVDMPAEKAVMLDADSNHLTLPAGLTINGALAGVTSLDVATLTIGTSLAPDTDNAVPLGLASKRWSDLRAMTATLSGLLSAAAGTFSGLLTAAAGAVVSATQTLALAGALVSGAPTWSSAQAITLSTASQPAITGVGALAAGSIAAGFGAINNAGNSLTTGALTATTASFAGAVAPLSDNAYALGTASFRWSDVRGVTATFTGGVTAALTGNASTATALQTARQINGVNFDGTGNITVTAAANTLTTTTLNATVVTSSLQSVGVLSGLTMGGAIAPQTDNLYALGTGAKRWSDLQSLTATFGGAVTLSSTLAIGGLTYTFPASQGANQFLQTNGSGTLSWVSEGATISLAGLSDVAITSATNGQALVYNSGTSKWNNSFVSLLTGLGTVTVGQWAAGAVNPATDNASTLGTASFRWSDVRGVTGTFSVNLTVSNALLTNLLQFSTTSAFVLKNTIASTLTSWDNTTGAMTHSFAMTVTGLVTANGGLTVASGQTLTLTGATVAGAPTWSSNQAITLSTAAQPNVTSLGTMAAPLLFVDNTYDIGASGATRPRSLYVAAHGFFGTYTALSGPPTVVIGGSNNQLQLDTGAASNAEMFFSVSGASQFRVGLTGAANNFRVRDDSAGIDRYTISNAGVHAFTGTATVSGLLTATGGLLIPTQQISLTGNFGYFALTGNGQARIGVETANGIMLTGQGSSYDVSMQNSAGTNVAVIPTGTTTFSMLGAVMVGGNLTFPTDATYDIGASGATRPRNYFGSGTGTFGGLITATGGLTVASGQTLTLTGSTVAGAPTWSSNQAITLSTAAQPNVTSLGTMAADLLFVDASYNIGANGANRPLNIFVAGVINAGGLGISGGAGITMVGSGAFTVFAGCSVVIHTPITADGLPTSAGAAGTLWVDTTGGLNIVKRA